VVLMHKNRPPRMLHYHLRPNSEHMVHEVELVDLLIGLHLLNIEKNNQVLAMIDVDNQAVIKAIELELRSLEYYLTWEAL